MFIPYLYITDSIYNHKNNTVQPEQDQRNLLNNILEFNNKSIPRFKKGKDGKRNTYESVYSLYEGQKPTFNAFNKLFDQETLTNSLDTNKSITFSRLF